MKTLRQQETEAILAMAKELEELREFKKRTLQTSKNIVEFVRNNPPSYKAKVEDAPKHVGYET